MRSIISYVSNKVALAFAFVGAVILAPAVSFAQVTFDFASSTEQSEALRNELVAQGTLIVLGALAAFLVIALILMGAGYTWGKFKKFTGISKKL